MTSFSLARQRITTIWRGVVPVVESSENADRVLVNFGILGLLIRNGYD